MCKEASTADGSEKKISDWKGGQKSQGMEGQILQDLLRIVMTLAFSMHEIVCAPERLGAEKSQHDLASM